MSLGDPDGEPLCLFKVLLRELDGTPLGLEVENTMLRGTAPITAKFMLGSLMIDDDDDE